MSLDNVDLDLIIFFSKKVHIISQVLSALIKDAFTPYINLFFYY